MKPKFYFFASSVEGDVMSGISVFTTSAKKAYNYAKKHFAKYCCKGEPVMLAI